DPWRGGLNATLNSYQVFEPATSGLCKLRLNRLAFVKAIQSALAHLSRVIVANCTAQPGDEFAVSVEADNAFLAGAVIVAANGNGPGTVGAPATDPKVIGVGARDVVPPNATFSGSSGPVDGGRIKPDIQVPTASETAILKASDPSQTKLLNSANGTSGATP